MMSKIALFLPSLAGGGAERVMVTMAAGFAETGHQVDLILAKAEGPYLDEVPRTVRIVDLQASRVATSLPSLVRYLVTERPRVLISALPHANVVAIVARQFACSPTKVIITIQSTPSASETGILLPWASRRLLPLADDIIAVSQGVATDAVTHYDLPPRKIKVIYNPVVSPELFAKAAEPVDHPWFGRNEPPVIIAVGRLTAAKDFTTLIRAYAQVRTKQRARLMILGEGEQRQKLQALCDELGVSHEVEFAGFVKNPYKYMNASSLFVLSSKWEGLPTVLIEAIALGVPAVSTDCPSGPAEILRGIDKSELVAVGDADALAGAMLRLLTPTVTTRTTIPPHDSPFGVSRAIQNYSNLFSREQK